MSSLGVPVSRSNFSTDSELYIFHSMMKKITVISDKVILGIYGVVLLLSIMQTFWKNKWIDHVLSYVYKVYSDGKFELNQVYFRQQTISCYRYDRRFSHIPHPSRSILFIASTHLQVLLLISIRTLFVRQSEFVNDCESFHYPYLVLECEDRRDPCEYNSTQIAPKCIYYHFQTTNFITMVTSIITWHYALRYFIIKLIRLVRWFLFRDNDQPRKCCFCCRMTPRMLRFLMCLQYLVLWIYLFFFVFTGFMWNLSMFRASLELSGSAWMPLLTATDRLCTLGMAFGPELIENWLNATGNGATLLDWESKGLLLVNVEPLVHLTNKKTETSASNQ